VKALRLAHTTKIEAQALLTIRTDRSNQLSHDRISQTASIEWVGVAAKCGANIMTTLRQPTLKYSSLALEKSFGHDSIL
jgi:hypothetical protein